MEWRNEVILYVGVVKGHVGVVNGHGLCCMWVWLMDMVYIVCGCG